LKIQTKRERNGKIGAREASENGPKPCMWGGKMYRRAMIGQQKLDIPFGVELEAENRWVKLAKLMPWEKIEERYAENFKSEKGEVAKSGRLAFAALYIQNRLNFVDAEVVEQIRENPSMQYFCGFSCYTTERPFDTSLLVHFRKRITPEMMKEISEEAFGAEAKKAIEKAKNKNNDDDENNGERKPWTPHAVRLTYTILPTFIYSIEPGNFLSASSTTCINSLCVLGYKNQGRTGK
jgi:hypothetical protein